MPLASGAGGFANDAAFQLRQQKADAAARAAGWSGVYTTDGVNFIPYMSTPQEQAAAAAQPPWNQQAPPSSPPPGGFQAALLGQTNNLGGNNMANQDIAGAYGPQTQYLQALGLGQGYQNPAQKYLANMYDQFRSIWGLQQPINTATGGTSQDWGQYVGNLGGGMQNVYSQAASTLQKLLGMSQASRAEAGFNFEPQYDPVTGQAFSTSETGEMSIANLQNLLGQGTAQRFGPIGSNWLAGRIPQLQQNWQLAQAGGGAGQTFLDYLRQKYGL